MFYNYNAAVFLPNKLCLRKSETYNNFFFLFLVQDSKKLTASPDGAITNENILRDYIASIEAKEDAKKELNNSSMMANQVWEAEAACLILFLCLNCYLKRYKEYINCF
jgi:hypothetical protein